MDEDNARVTVASDVLEATFRPDIGMLGTSLRDRGEQVLVVPDLHRRPHELAGLPFLAPWANRLGARRYEVDGRSVDLEHLPLTTDEHGLPIHGTMAWQPGWTVERATKASLRAGFDFGSHEELLASFPFPHKLTMDVAVDGSSLSSTTTLEPTGDQAVPVSFGYHPYLRMPGTSRAQLRLRLPKRRHLRLDGQGLPTGRADDEDAEEEAIGDRTFDDLYELGDDRRLELRDGGRRLTLRLDEGYPYAQVFAPPGSDYVCLEPMTAPVNALVDVNCVLVPPGEIFTATFSLHVECDAGR